MSGLPPKKTMDEILGVVPPPARARGVAAVAAAGADERPASRHVQGVEAEELVDEFLANNIAVEAIITMEEALTAPHPQLDAKGMVVTVADPDLGPLIQVGVPINLFGTPGEIRGPQPRIGEHNAEVWGEVGVESGGA
jgi:crotonobetainyl-CoA:carnitine CoA-transferase CaiB-like acyl-CoA transferase